MEPAIPKTEIDRTDRFDAPAARLERGAPLGRYVVLELLGQGGMGVVYAAYDPQLDRKVAVKLVANPEDPSAATGSRDRDQVRLLREAQALAKLQHPNVVAVHDVGALGDDVFLAMEYVEGDTLDAHLSRARPGWREVVRLFLEAGRGLAAAHAAGLVHRDFKPSNVLVGRDGRVCVLDFGLARASVRDPGVTESERTAEPDPAPGLVAVELTRMGVRAGTLGYMAPEQMAGADAEPRSDQFAFCAALYEALCDGQPPFQGADFASLLAATRAGAVHPPPVHSEVPAGVFALLERGLQARPEQRHSDLRSLLEQLAALSLRRRASDREAAHGGPPPTPGSKPLRNRVRARLGRALIRAGQRLLPVGDDRDRPNR